MIKVHVNFDLPFFAPPPPFFPNTKFTRSVTKRKQVVDKEWHPHYSYSFYVCFKINLSGCKLAPEKGDKYLSEIFKCPSLKKLDLSDNFLGTHIIQRNGIGKIYLHNLKLRCYTAHH